MALSIDVLQNSWKVAQIRYVNKMGAAMRVAVESQLVPFLISPRNRNTGSIASFAAKDLKRAVDANGKDVYEVLVKWVQKTNANASRPDTSGGFCDVDAEAITYKKQPYRLTNITAASILIDGNVVSCSPETRQQYFDDSMQALVEKAVFALARDVEDEFFARTDTSPLEFRHFGNLPKLQAAVTRYPGESLPLFQATDSEINAIGDQILERDRDLGGIMDRIFISDYSLAAYIKYKEMSGLGSNGYDFSMLNEVNRAAYFRSNRIYTNTGLARPVLSLPVGAAQLVTLAEFAADPEQSGNITKTAITDPVFGLQWNLVTELIECEGRRMKTKMTLDIVWALVVQPKCDTNDLRLDGTNGIYLYDIVCADTNVCALTPIEALYNSASTPKPECGATTDEFCAPACNVAIVPAIDGDDYTATANVVTSLGATVSSYAWTLNGTPLVATTREITLDNTTLSDGDVLAVTVTDSLGCVATNSIEVANGCPNPVYILNTNQGSPQTVVSGQTVNLGSFAAPVGDLEIFVVVANTNDVPLVVTAAAATGTGAGGVVTVFPATLDNGDEGAIDSATSVKTVGAKSIVFTIASNDCDNPTFTLTVTYTITA